MKAGMRGIKYTLKYGVCHAPVRKYVQLKVEECEPIKLKI